MAFLPESFEAPQRLETERFIMRPITIHDVVKDFEAVITSRAHLWAMFGEVWGWPPEDLTLEQDLIDLGWHQKEFQLRSSFDYAVMSRDETRLLGCVYVDPPTKHGYEAEVTLWVRADEIGTGLDDYLYQTTQDWLHKAWPFETIAYPGRAISWNDYGELLDR